MEDGPPIFNQDTTCPGLLIGNHQKNLFEYRTFTFFGRPFQERSSKNLWIMLHRAGSRSLAATNEISFLISFPLGTEMFQFPRFA